MIVADVYVTCDGTEFNNFSCKEKRYLEFEYHQEEDTIEEFIWVEYKWVSKNGLHICPECFMYEEDDRK